MSIRRRSRLTRAAGLAALTLAALYLVLLADWRGRRDAAPVVLRAFSTAGPLRAGAARIALAPPLPVVRAGYGAPRAVARTERDPLEVRAVVLRGGGKAVALVLVDLVLVPQELADALEARVADLRLDGLLLVATHTHSSVGGFDRRLLAQAVGTGRHRADVEAALLDRSAEALRRAAQQMEPIHVWTASTRLVGWAENRSTAGAAVDDTLTVAALRTDSGGAAVSTIAIVAAHPTLFPRMAPELSGDYPGEVMRRLGAGRGPALLLQGAGGDARPYGTGVEAIQTSGALIASRADEALAASRASEDRLGYADVVIELPPAEPQAVRSFFVQRPAANLVSLLAPATARVTVLALGDLLLLAVPGEPTALAAERIVAALPRDAVAGRQVRVVGLAQGYVGYIDTPERVRQGEGEARRAWFDADLLGRLTRGIEVAVTAAGGR